MRADEHPKFEVVDTCFEMAASLSRLRPADQRFVLNFLTEKFTFAAEDFPIAEGTNGNGNGKRRPGRPRKELEK